MDAQPAVDTLSQTAWGAILIISVVLFTAAIAFLVRYVVKLHAQAMQLQDDRREELTKLHTKAQESNMAAFEALQDIGDVAEQLQKAYDRLKSNCQSRLDNFAARLDNLR
jgi:hypothetical protein